MKNVVIALAVMGTLFAAISGTAVAGDIPDNMLSQMGLNGMERMTDDQGSQVRGEGFGLVFGIGGAAAILPTAMAMQLDGHFANSSGFNALAHGESGSTATAELSISFIGLSGTISTQSGTSGIGYAFGR